MAAELGQNAPTCQPSHNTELLDQLSGLSGVLSCEPRRFFVSNRVTAQAKVRDLPEAQSELYTERPKGSRSPNFKQYKVASPPT